MQYPKRLIEVDLPIKRISAHARREKSIRHGHISTLHIWWARRPLAACRAVICASLWPDPADPNCPQPFRDAALKQMTAFAKATQSNQELSTICDNGSWQRYMRLAHGIGIGIDIDAKTLKGQIKLRAHLLDFIADFAAWEASTNHWFLDTARSLTQVAHEALGGEKGSRPLVVDPFAGGGSIPLEALRVGADAYASDLNPIPVSLNNVLCNSRSRQLHLRQLFRTEAKAIGKNLAEMLAPAFETTTGSRPIAYLWARTITCQGPGCGAVVPLIRGVRLSKRGDQSSWLKMKVKSDAPFITVEVVQQEQAPNPPSVRSGAVTCPRCGFTTSPPSVRHQLSTKQGGSGDAMLTAVVERGTDGTAVFRSPDATDLEAVRNAEAMLSRQCNQTDLQCSAVPDEPIPPERPSPNARGLSAVTRIGMSRFMDLYTPRQLLVLTTLCQLVRDSVAKMRNSPAEREFADLVSTLLAAAVTKRSDFGSSLCSWRTGASCVRGTFARQALAITWDFGEMTPFSESAGDWNEACGYIDRFLQHLAESSLGNGNVGWHSATSHALPDDSCDAFITDPPYYDSVPYADLSDYCYVWSKRCLSIQPSNNEPSLTPKDDELIWNPSRRVARTGEAKDKQFYERGMRGAFTEGRRITRPNGVGIVVFAHKSTDGWEAILDALVGAGWYATGSWPIDTERSGRTNSVGTASLASSVHIVCRPRESENGEIDVGSVGDWRDVLAELPRRTHEWMGRLAQEGVVGADAIFACLGPALEIFSRYSRVEKASGEQVMLKEYLSYVWGAVAQEALTQIFKEADASGFEEDARLTAMWLWTLNAGAPTNGEAPEAADAEAEEASEDDDEEACSSNGKAGGGYVLEFDAARKIAQGLGAHLEDLRGVVEVKGDKARLLSVPERTRGLFGKDEAEAPQAKRKKKDKQMKLFSLEEVESEEGGWGDKSVPKLGDTTLDRVHQSMILFAAGRGEALRRFLTEDGAGRDQRFWKLANALSALYPQGTDEKRWVDGVLARKKGLGL